MRGYIWQHEMKRTELATLFDGAYVAFPSKKAPLDVPYVAYTAPPLLLALLLLKLEAFTLTTPELS